MYFYRLPKDILKRLRFARNWLLNRVWERWVGILRPTQPFLTSIEAHF